MTSKYEGWTREQLLAEQRRLTGVRREARAAGVAVQRELDHLAIEEAASKAAGRPVKVVRSEGISSEEKVGTGATSTERSTMP